MHVGVIGFGKMGRSIFNLFSDAAMAVTVVGRDPAEMQRQEQRLERRLRRAVASGVLPAGDLERRLADLRFTTTLDALHGCDLVVETIREDFAAKVDVLRRSEAVMAPGAVLTSNTSSLSLTGLGDHLRDPARFCGFHFFHPVQLTTIVEIVTTPRTARPVVELLQQVARDIERTPLVMRDLIGSCLNVPLIFYCCEGLYILEQGGTLPSRLDAIAGRIARIGPCETVDAIGLPFCLEIFQVALAAFTGDASMPDLCHRLLRDERVGRYTGRGIYMYENDRPLDDAPEYYRTPTQTHTPSGARVDDEALYERLLFAVYRSILDVTQRGLGQLGDVCVGVQRVLDLKQDPLEEMRRLGSKGMKAAFDRLRDDVGDRFDWRRLEGVLATLDEAR